MDIRLGQLFRVSGTIIVLACLVGTTTALWIWSTLYAIHLAYTYRQLDQYISIIIPLFWIMIGVVLTLITARSHFLTLVARTRVAVGYSIACAIVSAAFAFFVWHQGGIDPIDKVKLSYLLHYRYLVHGPSPGQDNQKPVLRSYQYWAAWPALIFGEEYVTYDSSDQIALPRNERSKDWFDAAMSENVWLYRSVDKCLHATQIDVHVYLVEVVCPDTEKKS
jgi:hypothetical protein